ncbi:hypothetical protein [Priestia aryabhattai]
MEGFKIKLKAPDIDFEMEIEKIEDQYLSFITDIIRMVDKKTTSPLQKIADDELRDKYIQAAKGYHEVSEMVRLDNQNSQPELSRKPAELDNYIASDVEQHLKEKEGLQGEQGIQGNEEGIKTKNNMDIKNEVDQDTSCNEKESSEVTNLTQKEIKEEKTTPKKNVGRDILLDKNKLVSENNNRSVENPTDDEFGYSMRYKTTGNGQVKIYQTYYKCANKGCQTERKVFIQEGQQYVYCAKCHRKMKVKSASFKGFPNKDCFGNIYVAGNFRVTNDTQLPESININKKS